MDRLSTEDLARIVEKHMPHSMDVGMKLDVDSPDGKVRMRIPAQPVLAADPDGQFWFPGILFTLADTACGLAAGCRVRRAEPMSTLDLRIDYLAPASLEHELIAEAECYRVTRSVIFVRCEVYCGTRERPAAIAVGTMMRTFYPLAGVPGVP